MRNTQSKDKFIRSLSASMHEMAQPLSIIQASLEMSLLEPTSAEEYKEVAKGVLRELWRAVDTMHFAAQLARFQQAAADEAEVEVGGAVEDAIEDMLRVFDTAQIRILFERPAHERPIRISVGRLRQMLFYVLQAVQGLSTAGDVVQMELRARAGHLILRIYHSSAQLQNCGLPTLETRPQEEEKASRALALADSIVSTSGGKFSVTAAPLLIVADFPVIRENKAIADSKTKLNESVHAQFMTNSH